MSKFSHPKKKEETFRGQNRHANRHRFSPAEDPVVTEKEDDQLEMNLNEEPLPAKKQAKKQAKKH